MEFWDGFMIFQALLASVCVTAFIVYVGTLIENKKYNHTEFVKDLVEVIFLGDETDNYSISFVLKNNNLIPKSIDFNKFKNNGYLRLLDFYEYRKIIFMDEDKLINITDGYDIVVYLDEDY